MHVSGKNRKPEDDGESLDVDSQVFLHIPEIPVDMRRPVLRSEGAVFLFPVHFIFFTFFVCLFYSNCLLFLFVSFLSCTLLVTPFALLWSLEVIATNTVADRAFFLPICANNV